MYAYCKTCLWSLPRTAGQCAGLCLHFSSSHPFCTFSSTKRIEWHDHHHDLASVESPQPRSERRRKGVRERVPSGDCVGTHEHWEQSEAWLGAWASGLFSCRDSDDEVLAGHRKEHLFSIARAYTKERNLRRPVPQRARDRESVPSSLPKSAKADLSQVLVWVRRPLPSPLSFRLKRSLA